MSLNPDQKATMVRPGDEEAFLKAHGFTYQTTLSYVDVLDTGPVIRVIPATCAGLNVIYIPEELVWANVWWNGAVYLCRLQHVHEPGSLLDFRTSPYPDLSGALKHARRMVAKSAPVPEPDWVQPEVKPLTSPYPSDSQYRQALSELAIID